MIRAIIWKEFREQGLIGLTLLVLGSGILTATATLADPPSPGANIDDVIRFLGAGLLATLLLSVTAGTVCGGALFAAEREGGTIGFLESLPVSRWQLWQAKVLAGWILVVLQVGIVLLVASALGIVPTFRWGVAITIYSFLAFVWGLYGSTHARTTLGSVGVAMPSAAFAALFFLIPITMIYHNPRTNIIQVEGGLIFLGLMFATPVAGSAWRFTRQDRERLADDAAPRSTHVRREESLPS
ncbi:MAG TPA: ABC transporter permease subunit, partial [Urbifossiella sp.]